MLLRRFPSPTRRIASTTAVAALLTILGAACVPGIGAPGSSGPSGALSCVATMGPSAGSVATTSATGPTPAGAPLSAPAAVAQATATYHDEAASSAATVPIVTVENTDAGPRIETHAVGSVSQAAAVATNAARGADLVSVEANSPVSATATPNDPLRSQQWAITKTTFGALWPGLVGAGVTIAVVDTGVDASHPDLAGRVLPGCRFLGTTNTGALGANDDHGHGTHVAGIAAALTNNGRGIEGAAPGVRILPVKVLDQNGQGYSSNIANGIVWATNNGAQVINMSLGGPSSSNAMAAAIAYARSRGVTVVAAAGNSALAGNAPLYPGATPGVIGVAAVDQNLAHASFSNTGSYVDLAAPGVGIISTLPGGTYASWNGTSMATPFVAAAAAIVKAARPACTPDGIQARLELGATDLGAPGRDTVFGLGLVNPLRALTVAGC
jgi:serine protease